VFVVMTLIINGCDLKIIAKRTSGRLAKALVYGLLVVLLAACQFPPAPSTPFLTPTPIQAPTAILPTPDPAIQQSIQMILDREVQAKRGTDQATYQALLDPEADPEWLQQQIELLQRAAYPNLVAIRAERIVGPDEWALATVIVEEATSAGPDLPSVQKTYTLRTLRNLGPEGWKLTSPAVAPWGEQHMIRLKQLHLTYYTFDEPYIQAVAPLVEPLLAQMAQDFGLSLAAEEPLTLHLVPAGSLLSFWDQTSGDKLPSPLTPGFSLAQAASPEEFLLGSLVDRLGHLLLERGFGMTPAEDGRFRLAHSAVQWEVDQAVGGQMGESLFKGLQEAGERASMSELLDPAQNFIGDSAKAAQRETLIYFIVEKYGRGSMASFLPAIVAGTDWQGIIRDAFGEAPADFEQQWQAWLDNR
jgi:hypothetical protein